MVMLFYSRVDLRLMRCGWCWRNCSGNDDYRRVGWRDCVVGVNLVVFTSCLSRPANFFIYESEPLDNLDVYSAIDYSRFLLRDMLYTFGRAIVSVDGCPWFGTSTGCGGGAG